MKNWVKFLLPVAIILGGVFVGQKVLQNKQNEPPKSGYLQTVGGISESSIDGVGISDGKGTININKEGIVWKLDGKNADQEKINNLISVVLDKDGVNYDLISQNPARFDDLNVSSSSAKVSLKSGETEKLAIFVGGSSYTGNFIRPVKENNVYLTGKSLGNLSTTDKQSYLEKPPQK